MRISERRVFAVNLEDREWSRGMAKGVTHMLEGSGWKVLNRTVDMGNRCVIFLCERDGPEVTIGDGSEG